MRFHFPLRPSSLGSHSSRNIISVPYCVPDEISRGFFPIIGISNILETHRIASAGDILIV